MRNESGYFPCAVVQTRLCSIHERTACIDYVVKKQGIFSIHVSDHVRDERSVGLGPVLVHDRHLAAQTVCKALGFLCAPAVSRDHHSIFRVKPDFLYSRRNKLGDGNVPEVTVHETLDLVGVQVNRNQIVHAGAHYQVGDKLCGNRLAGLCLAVLPRVAQVRDDRSDFLGIASPRSVAQNQEFHERVVDRKLFSLFGKGIANALQNENVLSPQAFVD